MVFFFFKGPATTEIYTLSPTRRSSDLRERDEDSRANTTDRAAHVALAYSKTIAQSINPSPSTYISCQPLTERWKCTCHQRPSRRCQTRVSSDAVLTAPASV